MDTAEEGGETKAELVELTFSAHLMKLAKVSDSESQKEKAIMAELLTTDEGVLPEPTCYYFQKSLSLISATISLERPRNTRLKT